MSVAEQFLKMDYGPAPEDPKDTLVWLDRHARKFGHFVDGAWHEPAEGAFFDTINPATGEKIASVAQGSAADIDAAVKAARRAFPQWQALKPHARARHLYALARGPATLSQALSSGNHRQRQTHPRKSRH